MASRVPAPYRIAVGLATAAVVAIGTRTVYLRFADGMTPPAEPTQVEKLVAKTDTRAECGSFRAKLQAQEGASPAAGSTQYAIAEAWQSASQAGCIAK